MTWTPLAIEIAPSGVAAGVGLDEPGLSPVGGGAVGDSAGLPLGTGDASGSCTGTTNTSPPPPSSGSDAIASWLSPSATWVGRWPSSIASPLPPALGTQLRSAGTHTSSTSIDTSSHEPLTVSRKIVTGSASGSARPVGAAEGTTATPLDGAPDPVGFVPGNIRVPMTTATTSAPAIAPIGSARQAYPVGCRRAARPRAGWPRRCASRSRAADVRAHRSRGGSIGWLRRLRRSRWSARKAFQSRPHSGQPSRWRPSHAASSGARATRSASDISVRARS